MITHGASCPRNTTTAVPSIPLTRPRRGDRPPACLGALRSSSPLRSSGAAVSTEAYTGPRPGGGGEPRPFGPPPFIASTHTTAPNFEQGVHTAKSGRNDHRVTLVPGCSEIWRNIENWCDLWPHRRVPRCRRCPLAAPRSEAARVRGFHWPAPCVAAPSSAARPSSAAPVISLASIASLPAACATIRTPPQRRLGRVAGRTTIRPAGQVCCSGGAFYSTTG